MLGRVVLGRRRGWFPSPCRSPPVPNPANIANPWLDCRRSFDGDGAGMLGRASAGSGATGRNDPGFVPDLRGTRLAAPSRGPFCALSPLWPPSRSELPGNAPAPVECMPRCPGPCRELGRPIVDRTRSVIDMDSADRGLGAPDMLASGRQTACWGARKTVPHSRVAFSPGGCSAVRGCGHTHTLLH